MSSADFEVVRMTTGISFKLSAALISANTSWPFLRGMFRSSTIKSGRGTAAYFVLRGTYFVPDVKVYVFGAGLSADSIAITNENRLTVHITAAADAALGTASIVVAVPGTGAGQSFGGAAVCTCLQVTN